MTWTFTAQRGVANSKVSGSTLSMSPTSTVPAGSVAIVRGAFDNIATTSGQSTNTTVTDSVGNTWTRLREHTRSSGVAADGVGSYIWMCNVTTAITTGATVTLTLSSAILAKTIAIDEYAVDSGNVGSLKDAGSVDGSGTTPTVTISGLPSAPYLLIGATGAEGPGGDTFTQDASYTGLSATSTTGSTADTNISNRCGRRIATLTTDTFNPVMGTSRDYVAMLVVLEETVPAVSGTFSTTLDGAVLAATGTVDSGVDGTLATTLDGAALAATGGQTISGTLATALDDAALAAVGGQTISGTLASTLDGATLAATGGQTISGTLASTLDGAALAASGSETISGTLALTLDGAAFDSVGSETISGTLASTLDGASLAGTGTLTISGTLAASLDDAVLAAAGGLTISGTLATTLQGATLVAQESADVSGTMSTTLQGGTLAAVGSETISGAMGSSLDGATLAATAVQTFLGELGAALDGATMIMLAVESIEGALSTILEDATLVAIEGGVIEYTPAGRPVMTIGSIRTSATINLSGRTKTAIGPSNGTSLELEEV